MLQFIAYILLIIFVLLLGIFCLFYALSNLIALILGAPFVASRQRQIDTILDKVQLKPQQLVIELGSGDGRFLRSAVKKYNVKGLGIEIQPWLLIYARIRSKMQHLKNISFKNQNFFNADLSQADVIFAFLLPPTLKKLRPKFLKECKPNVIIISHGFRIEGFEKYLFNQLDHQPYRTYFYKLTKS